MISVMAKFTVRKESLNDALDLVKTFVQAVEQEEGTLSYDAYHNGCSFVHFMTFKNTEAEQLHKQTFHVKTFVEKLYPLCVKEPEFTHLDKVQ